MNADEIEAELQSLDYDTDGVVAWDRRQAFYAVGYRSDDLPEINGYRPISDPALEE